MAAGCVGIGIGGEVTRKELVENADWAAMSEIVKEYVCRVKSGKDEKK
jgi:2-keto-3-deoxy-6-phosphogluconate aldolase